MEQSGQEKTRSAARSAATSELAGCYVYCVIPGSERASLGKIGIDGREVYTAGHRDLSAVVHDCLARPYQSDDGEVAGAWVLAHHRVVDAAWKRWATVLPVVFNTIIEARQATAEQNLVAWLEAEYQSLKRKLEVLAGKGEFGVQVFWDVARITKRVVETSPEIRKLEGEIGSKPRGLAYMYGQRLGSLLRKEIETRAAEEFKHLYGRISKCVDAIRVEKTKKGEEGRQMLMLMNLCCLVSMEKHHDLEAEMDRISNMEGFSVRLVGPLPPYSFS